MIFNVFINILFSSCRKISCAQKSVGYVQLRLQDFMQIKETPAIIIIIFLSLVYEYYFCNCAIT